MLARMVNIQKSLYWSAPCRTYLKCCRSPSCSPWEPVPGPQPSPPPSRSHDQARAPAKLAGLAKAAPAPTGERAKTVTTRTAKAGTTAVPAKGRTTPSTATSRTASASKAAPARTTVARASRPAAKTRPRSRSNRPATGGHGDGAVDVESGAAPRCRLRGQVIYSKNPDEVLPIASITKLMTALVVLDAGLPLDETITITEDDKDHLRNTRSRLQVGSQLTRRELLHVALMSSENRGRGRALGRTHPAGKAAFVQLMNAKARLLGMRSTQFCRLDRSRRQQPVDARDLVKLAHAASAHPLIREFTTTPSSEVEPGTRRNPMLYRNTNRLVRGGNWDNPAQQDGLFERGRSVPRDAGRGGGQTARLRVPERTRAPDPDGRRQPHSRLARERIADRLDESIDCPAGAAAGPSDLGTPWRRQYTCAARTARCAVT